MMQPLIAFDMGNVLLPFDHMRACRNVEGLSGIPADRIYELIFAAGVENLFESGELAGDEFFSTCMQRLGVMLDRRSFEEAWSDIFTADPEMAELVAALAGRNDLCLVSNTNLWHMDWVSRTYRVMSNFRNRLLSFELRAMKPRPEVYAAILRQSRAGQRVIFVDDMPVNVTAASAAGIIGIRFTDAATLRAELRRLGVQIDGDSKP